MRFRYLARPHVPVLRGLDLDVKPGQFIALCGPSGASIPLRPTLTLRRLWQIDNNPAHPALLCVRARSPRLTRADDVLSGSVEIDGQNISSYNLRTLRSRMALVSQEVRPQSASRQR